MLLVGTVLILVVGMGVYCQYRVMDRELLRRSKSDEVHREGDGRKKEPGL